MVTRTGSPVEVTWTTVDGFAGAPVDAGKAGLVLGEDQQGDVVSVALFRPQPTRVLAIGSARFAVLLGFRALALGARIGIRSADPRQWNLLVRQGLELDQRRPARPGGLPPRPTLTMVDHLTGPPPTDAAEAEPGHLSWSTTLAARSGFTTADVAALGRADLVLSQPLPPAEAALVAEALRLPPAHAAGFTAIRPDLVVVIGEGTVRWVRLAPSLVEYHLIGDPAHR